MAADDGCGRLRFSEVATTIRGRPYAQCLETDYSSDTLHFTVQPGSALKFRCYCAFPAGVTT